MMRHHRAGLAGLFLWGSLSGAAAAQERMVSLLPPVGRVGTAADASGPPVGAATPGANPLVVAPYDPAAGGLMKPRGANLPKGAPLVDAAPIAEGMPVSEAAPAAGSPLFQMEVPNVAMPDFHSHLSGLFCSGPINPADVDDPTWCRFEFLMWWFRDADLPPLVTTSANPADLGILGAPTTSVLFGGTQHLPMKLGGRAAIGSWFDPTERLGVEVGYTFLINRSEQYYGFTDGGVLLARPFFNAQNGTQDSAIVGTPDIPEFDIFRHPGTVAVDLPGRLDTFELHAVSNYCRGANGRIDLLFGFRYLFLGEGVNIFEAFKTPADSPELPNYLYISAETFGAKNYVYAPQVGVRTQNRWGCLTLNLEGKLGMGWNHTAAKLTSSTHEEFGNSVRDYPGGLLIQKTNAGSHNGDHFIVVPEVGAKLTWEVVDHVSVSAGYSFLFLSTVWRPGDLIDLRVNPNQIPPREGNLYPKLPEFVSQTSSFWAQGVTMGIEVKY